MGDFNAAFSFDLGGGDEPTQAPWEFAGGTCLPGRAWHRARHMPCTWGRCFECGAGARSGGAPHACAHPPPDRDAPTSPHLVVFPVLAGVLNEARKEQAAAKATSIDHKIQQQLQQQRALKTIGNVGRRLRCRALQVSCCSCECIHSRCRPWLSNWCAVN